MEDLLAKIK